MKHPLHRKKLQLALQALRSPDDLLKGKLDHNWVTRELASPRLRARGAERDGLSALLCPSVPCRLAGRRGPAAVQESL